MDILGQQFYQLMQQPKERVGEFGGNLEYKFKLLQEKCPGRFTEDQLRDRFVSWNVQQNLGIQSGFCTLSQVVISILCLKWR